MKAVNSGLLDRAREAKTAAQFSVVVGELEEAIAGKRALLATINTQTDSAFFEGGDLDKLRRDKAAAEVDLSELETALAGAQRRRSDAVTAEHEADMERIGAELQEHGKALAAKHLEFQDTLLTLRHLHADIDRLKSVMERKNDQLETGGRRGLRVLPANVRRDAIGDAIGEAAGHALPDLSREGAKIDVLLRDLGTPVGIRVEPRRRSLRPHGHAINEPPTMRAL